MKILCGDSFSLLTLAPHSSPKKWDINQTLGNEQSLHVASQCSQYLSCSHCLHWMGAERVWCSEGNQLPTPLDPAFFDPVTWPVMQVDIRFKNLSVSILTWMLININGRCPVLCHFLMSRYGNNFSAELMLPSLWCFPALTFPSTGGICAFQKGPHLDW